MKVKVKLRHKFFDKPPPDTVTEARAAELLGISRRAVRLAVQQGRLETTEVPVVEVRRAILAKAVRRYTPSAARIRAGRGRRRPISKERGERSAAEEVEGRQEQEPGQ